MKQKTYERNLIREYNNCTTIKYINPYMNLRYKRDIVEDHAEDGIYCVKYNKDMCVLLIDDSIECYDSCEDSDSDSDLVYIKGYKKVKKDNKKVNKKVSFVNNDPIIVIFRNRNSDNDLTILGKKMMKCFINLFSN